MKTITTILALIVIACVGCKTARRVDIITDRVDKSPRHITKREEAAIRETLPPQEQTMPQPPITADSKYASICPYCDTVNLSDVVNRMGGGTVTNGQPITVTIRLGIVTNIISTVNGNLENWCMTYTCSNCREPYSDFRDQLTPKTRSVRLPLRSE